MTTTSAGELDLLARTKLSRFTDPTSSSPSMINLMLSGSAPRLLQVRFDRLEVHEHLALVVGGAARVDLAIAHGRLEGRRLPEIDGIHGLHVVVPVEQNGRRARRMQPVAVDDRIARRVDEPHVLETNAAHFVGASTLRSVSHRPRARAAR